MSGAQNSSPDTGRLFPVGEMSRDSTPRHLPTPSVMDGSGGTLYRNPRKDAKFDTNHAVNLEQSIHHWSNSSAEDSPASPYPTPASGKRKPTNAGSGPSSPGLLASFDPATSSWRTFQDSLLQTEDERFPRSSETWPRWAMWDATGLYELPTSVLPTDGNASSSLRNVPTPTARLGDQRGAQAKRYTNPARSNDLDDFVLTLPTPHGMPTEGQPRNPGPTGNELGRAITRLLPTPTAETGGDGQRPDGFRRLLEPEVKRTMSLCSECRCCTLPLPNDLDEDFHWWSDEYQMWICNCPGPSGDPTDPLSNDGSE